VIGKYIEPSPDSETRAEEAFRRALEVNPRLSVAHKHYAKLESDMGQAERAIVRLLGQATRHGNDPELFSGLVHACRYCGLFDQSIAAHREARRLDPNVPTSVEQTTLMTGDLERLLAIEPTLVVAGADDGIRVIGLGLAGRREDARRALEAMRRTTRIATFNSWAEYLTAWIDKRAEGMWSSDMSALDGLKIREDPEAIFQEGWLLCDVGEHQKGLAYLRRAVEKGYFVAHTLAHSRHFDALRGDAGFEEVLALAEAGRDRALAAFREAGGERLLGR
jgi:tetratricopeptide (TPR) repeat protein